jgi:hypothetical protein
MGTKEKTTAVKKSKTPAPEKKTSTPGKKEANSLLFKERLFLQDLVGQKVTLEKDGDTCRVKVVNVDLNAGVLVLRGITQDHRLYQKTAFIPIDKATLVL